MTSNTVCTVCQHATGHGYFGLPRGTHCRQCHRTWTSTREGHCPQCCEHFAGYSAFDAHLDSQARCWGGRSAPLTGDFSRANRPVLHLGPDGVWSGSESRNPAAAAARLRNARKVAA